MTTAAVPYVIGTPGMRSSLSAELRRVLSSTSPQFLIGNRWIDGTKARDPGNTPYVECLRAGLVMGKITSSGYYANSFFGTLTNAEVTGSTQLEVSAAAATEIVRRIGASGTLKVTGPPAASGTVRTLTYTYSAVNTSTGAITVTALGANEVQTLTFNAAATGGNIALRVPNADGTMEVTALAAWNATDATYLAAIQTALDNATGVANGIVVSGAAPDTALTFTFSGTGFAGNTYNLIEVVTYPTTPTHYSTVRTTSGVNAAQIAGAFVCPTDGSETPQFILPDGAAMQTTDLLNTTGVSPLEFPQIPAAAQVLTAYVINYPTDSSLKTWLKQSLSTLDGPKLTFDDI